MSIFARTREFQVSYGQKTLLVSGLVSLLWQQLYISTSGKDGGMGKGDI